MAFVGPPNGGSPPPRPRLVAEDLLLYDRDGQSLLDDHALRILIALHQESLTAQAIASRYRVPIAACYRRVRRLVSLGLISEAGFVTEGRRRPARLYRSEVDRFQITYGSGKMQLLLMLRNGTETKTIVGIPPDLAVSGTTPPPPRELGEYPSARCPGSTASRGPHSTRGTATGRSRRWAEGTDGPRAIGCARSIVPRPR